MAVTQGRMTRIISSVVANPPDSPKITTSAYGLVVSNVIEVTQLANHKLEYISYGIIIIYAQHWAKPMDLIAIKNLVSCDNLCQ